MTEGCSLRSGRGVGQDTGESVLKLEEEKRWIRENERDRRENKSRSEWKDDVEMV